MALLSLNDANLKALISSLADEFNDDPKWLSQEVFRWHHKKIGWLKGRCITATNTEQTIYTRLSKEQDLDALCNPKRDAIHNAQNSTQHTSAPKAIYKKEHLHLSFLHWIHGDTLSNEVRQGNVQHPWLQDIEQSLARLHSSGFIHGDIKPNNIIIGRKQAHLIDFSTAMPIGQHFKHLPFAATSPSYSSPQQKTLQGRVCPSDDWYALALTLCASFKSHPYYPRHSTPSSRAIADYSNAFQLPAELPARYHMIIRNKLRAYRQ